MVTSFDFTFSLPQPSFPLSLTVIPAQAGIHGVCLVPHFEKGGLGGI
jgi:hypothetical protein